MDLNERKKILVIDDDFAILEMIKYTIDPSVYEVITAMDAESALEKMADTIPDAIVLDIKLPGMSGYLFAAILQEKDAYKDIPIILLTGTSLLFGNVVMDVPAAKYRLSKPCDCAKLSDILDQLFQDDKSSVWSID
tara:strand:- start:2066 stop:2473 length:408 start_codon:yes stop_codon:yes gene_type:complete